MNGSQPEIDLTERDAYQALCLAPGAPRELVVETYWVLVQRILHDAPSDADAQGNLEALNQAYALVTSRDTPSAAEEPVQEKPKRGRTPLRHKLLKRGAMRPVARNPWEVLHVHPSAPQDVIDLAYRFWQVRYRNAWYDANGTQGERLEEAYASLRTLIADKRAQPPAPDEPAAPEPPPATGVNVTNATIHTRPEPPLETPLPPETEAEAAEPPPLPEADLAPPPTTQSNSHDENIEPVTPETEQPTAGTELQNDEELVVIGLPWSQQRSTAQVTPILPDPLAQALRNSPPPKVVGIENGAPTEALPPVAKEAGSSPHSSKPHIVLEAGRDAGRLVEVGAVPVHINAGDGHVEVSSNDAKGLVARIWSLRDEVMFHAVGTEPMCRVNGCEVTWAVLEDGDTIQVGEDLLRFRRNGH